MNNQKIECSDDDMNLETKKNLGSIKNRSYVMLSGEINSSIQVFNKYTVVHCWQLCVSQEDLIV